MRVWKSRVQIDESSSGDRYVELERGDEGVTLLCLSLYEEEGDGGWERVADGAGLWLNVYKVGVLDMRIYEEDHEWPRG